VLRVMTLGGLGILTVLGSGCARPSVSQGRALYRANGCASCHGPDGHGDGPLASKLPATPIDFRDASLFKRGTTEKAIAKTIEEGIAQEHTVPALHLTHHELLMPKFDHLTETERRSIALYVISLRTAPLHTEGTRAGTQP
jgi:high-affinity iron transporter